MTQAYNLSQLANNLNSTGQLDATDGLVNSVPVVNGGTGASSAAGAIANLGSAIYPVGSIYINAASATNPATLFGFGTWVEFGAGRVPIGVGGGFTAGSTGGSADAALVAHQHYVSGTTNPAGASSGAITGGNGTGDFGIFNNAGGNFSLGGHAPNRPQGTAGGESYVQANLDIPNHQHDFGAYTNWQGESSTNKNLQPYIVVYMWQRVA